jgi:hypothetical protein
MQPIPLFGTGIKSYSDVVTSQRRLNCFFDARPDGDRNAFILRGTPGTVLRFTLPTSPIRGMSVVKGLMYIIAGSILYEINSSGTVTSRGALSTGTGIVSIADNGIEIGIVDGTKGYIYTIATTTLAAIVDANFPAGATTISFLNGRFQVEKAGSRQYYISQSYAGATWTPAIFASKENSSDNIIAVQVWNGTLILWGPTSMEFWQDVGASPVPYQRINGASQTWGLAAVYSRSELNNSIVFLGQNPQGSVQVLMLNGYSPTRISTSDIEHIINGFTTFSDAVSLTYMIDGHPMYQLTFPTGNRSFLYDAATNMWQEVQTGLSLQNRHYANLGVVFNTLNYVSDFQSGNLYQLSDSVYTDNGTYIKREGCTRHVRNGGNEFSIDELIIDMETGVGLQNGQGQDPKIMLQISKDGGRTFGTERWASVGKVGQYFSPRVIWRRLGMAVDFVFKFRMTDPVKFIITSGSASSSNTESGNG